MKSKFLILCAIAACVALLCPALASATSLGTAASFAVLAGTTVTNTGPTTITGDLGVWPGSSITGFPPGIVNGTIHQTDTVAQLAQSDLTTAYTTLAALPFGTDLTGQDLGGQTLTSGIYKYSSSAGLTGTLLLDALGASNAEWVFQIGSALTTASDSKVQWINAGSNNSVFWQVGSSATLGTGTAFEGNILALTSITLTNGATILNGRALARNGAVTLDTNTINVPIPPSMLLLSSGLAGLAALRLRKRAKKA